MVVTSARQLSLGDALRQGSGLLDARVGEEQHLEPIVGVATIHLFSCMPRPLRSFARLASAVDEAPSGSIAARIALRELPFALPTGGRPRQAAISDAIRSAMQVGRLRPGARLPSSRDLARQLRVARG